MTLISITVPGVPVAKGRARSARTKSGKTIHYTPEKTAIYEKTVADCAAIAMSGKSILNGAISLYINFYLPIPKSFSKKNWLLSLENKLLPITKPDCDNLTKSVCDAMNGIVYKDDSQIVRLYVIKLYSDNPRAVVVAQEYTHVDF